MTHDIDAQIAEAIQNIKDDRAVAFDHVMDLWGIIKKDGPNGHKMHGTTQSKYLETLQRSNDQLVKLLSILARRNEKSSEDLSEAELGDLMDKVQREENKRSDRQG